MLDSRSFRLAVLAMFLLAGLAGSLAQAQGPSLTGFTVSGGQRIPTQPYQPAQRIPKSGKQFLSPAPAVNNPPHGAQGTKPNFLPEQFVLRKEMAAFIINAQFDGEGIVHYLANTLGGITQSSFADVPVGGGNGVSAVQQRAIEVMYRRGYTRGCGLTDDGTLKFCPNDETTRGQMAVFMIRAKMNNVFPTVFSGCPTGPPGLGACTNGGDSFGLFLPTTPYFPLDTPATHPYFIYIQKLREMRITIGIGPGLYGSDLTPPPNTAPPSKLTRSQMATFIVRGFFI